MTVKLYAVQHTKFTCIDGLCCNFDKLMHQRSEKMEYFCGYTTVHFALSFH